jgi:hypothetical protein
VVFGNGQREGMCMLPVCQPFPFDYVLLKRDEGVRVKESHLGEVGTRA